MEEVYLPTLHGVYSVDKVMPVRKFGESFHSSSNRVALLSEVPPSSGHQAAISGNSQVVKPYPGSPIEPFPGLIVIHFQSGIVPISTGCLIKKLPRQAGKPSTCPTVESFPK